MTDREMEWKKDMQYKKAMPQKNQTLENYPDFEVRTDLCRGGAGTLPGDGGEVSGVSLRKMAGEQFGYPHDGSENSG